MAKAADAGAFDRRNGFLALALVGLIDAATDQAERLYAPERSQKMNQREDYLASSLLFVPATAPLRRDERFLALAARLGLVDYWRSSGDWPDVCAEPGLPYDCRAEAARFKAASTSAPRGT